MTKEQAIKFLQQIYPNGGHCWLDEQRIEAIGMAVKALQEEPVSKVWHDASEKPEKEKLCLVLSNIDAIGGNKHLAYFVDNKETGKCGFLFGGYIGMDMVVKWAYIDDIINL